MTLPDFQRNYFELFDLPADFDLDLGQLGERYREVQRELHPDRYARASAHEQRLAVQYSALINEAYATLRKPLPRALYLLELSGMSREAIENQPLDGGFLITQMELREKLESIDELVDPEPVLERLLEEIGGDIAVQQAEFARTFPAGDSARAAAACVKMQYLDKLLREAEQAESSLLEK
jgi:molecular chaperone HscB